MTGSMSIRSRDYWVKVVEMLQQNWALIDTNADGSAHVFFVSDARDVFDEMDFASAEEAEVGLKRNGFRLLAARSDMQRLLRPPASPFTRGEHPNGAIYSSGRYWR